MINMQQNNNLHSNVFVQILVFTGSVLAVLFLSVYFLYQVSFDMQRDRLMDIVYSQKHLIEAVALFDSKYSKNDVEGGAFGATLSQVKDAHVKKINFGETGEFLFAQLKNNKINFLIKLRHASEKDAKPIAYEGSKDAEPMRRALSGETGSIMALDYRSEMVLAAFAPIEILNIGIVAKIDLKEIQTPFYAVVIYGGLSSMLLISLVVFWFFKENKKLMSGLENAVQARTFELESAFNEIKIHQDELMVSKQEAEQANQAKSDFLARMSHELRTPMNAILGFTQLLEMNPKSNLSDNEKKNLEMVSSAGNHLLDLINEVLDLSSIESKEMKLSLEIIDIIPVVDNVISISKSMAEEKGLSLDYKKAPHGNCFVLADSLRFKQVVLNLISNAIKYNIYNGSVIVSYEKLNNGMMRIGVQDTGHGIPNDKKESLFKPFERFDVDSEQIEGTGIGLTITKQLVELMGGTIDFESTIEEGSFFYVDMPVSDKTPLVETETKELPSQDLLNGSEKTILYIEDIPANVRLVRNVSMILRH
jgi:signal transduction histidine kinase